MALTKTGRHWCPLGCGHQTEHVGKVLNIYNKVLMKNAYQCAYCQCVFTKEKLEE